jgi:hypothetical protein
MAQGWVVVFQPHYPPIKGRITDNNCLQRRCRNYRLVLNLLALEVELEREKNID